MNRALSERCEICNLYPPNHGIGFPAWPGATPGLPDHLRGMCLWVCANRRCGVGAQIRAAKAAAAHGVQLTSICRVHIFKKGEPS